MSHLEVMPLWAKIWKLEQQLEQVESMLIRQLPTSTHSFVQAIAFTRARDCQKEIAELLEEAKENLNPLTVWN